MDHHLAKHRPVITWSEKAEGRRNELSSQQRRDQQVLRQRLSKQYGMQGLEEVDMPSECKAFLSEVPTLVEDKRKQDDKQREAEEIKNDACK